MSGHPCTDDIPIRGYLSEASKRRFTIIAGLLGTGFLFGQFALPFALMAGFMVSSADTFDVDFARRSPHNAAIWDRGLWLVETESGLGEEPKSSMLVRTDIGDSSDLNAVTSTSRPFRGSTTTTASSLG